MRVVQLGPAGLVRRVTIGEPFGAACRGGITCEGGALLRVDDLVLLTISVDTGKAREVSGVCLRPREFRFQIFCRTGYCPVKNKENFFAKCTENYMGWSTGKGKAKCTIFVKTFAANGLWGAR